MRLSQALALAVAGTVSWACDVLVGDDCISASECSQTEARLCLTEQFDNFPGGYCTSFNCAPGSCPSEAVCIGYGASPGGDACRSPYSEGRTQRNFCMRSCTSNADCRSGYECLDPTAPGQPWGAVLMETDGSDPRVCVVAYTGMGDAGESSVCSVQPPPGDAGAAASTDPSAAP